MLYSILYYTFKEKKMQEKNEIKKLEKRQKLLLKKIHSIDVFCRGSVVN